MEMGWLDSLLYGFMSGLTEILPVSADGHQRIFLWLKGGSEASPMLSLFVHLGVLAALLVSCGQHIRRIRRGMKAARIPRRRRKRPLDERAVLDGKLLKTAVFVSLLFFFLKAR